MNNSFIFFVIFDEKQKKLQEAEILYATEKQKMDTLEQEILKFDSKLAKLREDLENTKQEKQENLAKLILSIISFNEASPSSNDETSKLDFEQNEIVNKMWEEYELTPNNIGDVPKIENPTEVQKQVNRLRGEIRDLVFNFLFKFL
mgnify:CR=1 FL=1